MKTTKQQQKKEFTVMNKLKIVEEFRAIQLQELTELCEVQSILIDGEYTQKTFNALQKIIDGKFKFYDALTDLQNSIEYKK